MTGLLTMGDVHQHFGVMLLNDNRLREGTIDTAGLPRKALFFTDRHIVALVDADRVK